MDPQKISPPQKKKQGPIYIKQRNKMRIVSLFLTPITFLSSLFSFLPNSFP